MQNQFLEFKDSLYNIKLSNTKVLTSLLKLMGNQQTQHINKEDWEVIRTASNQNQLLRNRKDRQFQIEEYYLESCETQKLQAVKQLYFLRKNHSRWIAGYFFTQDDSEQFCTSRFSVKLYLERIHKTLNQLSNISFCDSLHFFSQALHGYWEFAKRFGCFEVQPQYMGLNDHGVLKVWAGSNWTQINVIGGKISQYKMVRSIIQVVQASVQQLAMSATYPKFRDYVYRTNKNVGFQQCLRQLQEYAKIINQGVIPKSLNIVKQFQVYPTIQSRKIYPLIDGRQYLHSNRSSSPRLISSNIKTQRDKKQMFSSAMFSLPTQHSKIKFSAIQTHKNQISVRKIPQIAFFNKTSVQSPSRISKPDMQVISNLNNCHKSAKYSTNQGSIPIKNLLQVPPAFIIYNKYPRLTNQAVSKSIFIPETGPSLGSLNFKASKQHLGSNKSIQQNVPGKKSSIIMQLYQSHDNIKVNPNQSLVQQAKDLAETNRLQAANDLKQGPLNPIFQKQFPQMQQSPRKQKKPYLFSPDLNNQNKLNLSNQTKKPFTFSKRNKNSAEISQNDGKTSEELMSKLRGLGTGPTFTNQLGINSEPQLDFSQYAIFPLQLVKHNQSQTGSSLSPQSITAKVSVLQNQIEGKQTEAPPNLAYTYYNRQNLRDFPKYEA